MKRAQLHQFLDTRPLILDPKTGAVVSKQQVTC
jgi:hypothetical protein